jgi:hypothetical protein
MSLVKSTLLALFLSAGFATGVACDAEEIIDCTDLCDELDSCFDEGFGTVDCIDSCEEQAEATIDNCDACLDESERECSECTGVCSVFIEGGF